METPKPLTAEQTAEQSAKDAQAFTLDLSTEKFRFFPTALSLDSAPYFCANPDWQKPIKKTVYTLNIGNYEPAICELTYPLMKAYARKIGADFKVITERKFPEWPVVYEKLQIYELSRGWMARQQPDGSWTPPAEPNDWNIFIDSDALVNPEMFDITEHLRKDTVLHNGKDMAGVRWSYDQYFRRDGRNIGSCNWFTVGSDWCLDLWRPLDDLTPEQAYERIHITNQEHNSGHCKREHLIDDYTLSRNIAKFGLKFATLTEICGNLGWKDQFGRGVSPFLFHLYTLPTEGKLQKMLEVLSGTPDKGGWQIMPQDEVMAFNKKWGLK